MIIIVVVSVVLIASPTVADAAPTAADASAPRATLAVARALCQQLAPPFAKRRYPAPTPGSAAYLERDDQNMTEALFGRNCLFATDTNVTTDLRVDFARAVEQGARHLAQLLLEPARPALTFGDLFPGADVGSPLRAGWNGTLGERVPVAFTNRYGALIRGDLFAPLPGERDPYSGKVLRGPFPGVVVTEGSIQATRQMYYWIAEDLAMSGYVVLVTDVQGQGASETFPHQPNPLDKATGTSLPWCDPLATPAAGQETGCPGVPSQQTANFVYGTEDAISFFLSDPAHPYPDPGAGSTPVDHVNPLWKLFDRLPMAHPNAPGRTTRLAIIGHSLGAFAVSYVQEVDPAVAAVVAYDKLISNFDSPAAAEAGGPRFTGAIRPVVPALAIQSEYFVAPVPYWMNGSSSFEPSLGSPEAAPNPAREEETGFDAWVRHGVSAMVIVPRASTHLDYTDIPGVPASRYGEQVASYYTREWLDRYLKHRPGSTAALLTGTLRYDQPLGDGHWKMIDIHRNRNLSVYFCSGYELRRTDGEVLRDFDLTHDGCGAPR